MPRTFSLPGIFCALFFLAAQSGASLAAPTHAERNTGSIFDLIPPPDVRYPGQTPVTGFDIDGTKPPVSPTAPEPHDPGPPASVPPSLEKLLRQVASDTQRPETASAAVRAVGTAAPAASPTSKISATPQRAASATTALTGPKAPSRSQEGSRTSPAGREPATGSMQAGQATVPAVASQTSLQVSMPVPAFTPASISTEATPTSPPPPVASLIPAIVSPGVTASTEAIPAPASPVATLATDSPSAATAEAAASQPAETASASDVPGEQQAVTDDVSQPTADTGQPADTASAEAVIQKAREYHEVGSFKKMLALLDENQDLIGEMPEAAALRLEQYLNDPQPDYRLMRSAAGIILERDDNDVDANYAMGLYWSSLKKPDLGKALKHLALAKNAKKARPGAASLYWWLFMKKYWYLFLLPLLIVAAAIDKRRKQQAGLPAIGAT
ncbi:hypothetical protein KBA41_02415, partial [Candidatus Ozemobacteraceae bacterium]|nr:hypothetical protein [Candidatus Ozemobacteraceae bacterium]